MASITNELLQQISVVSNVNFANVDYLSIPGSKPKKWLDGEGEDDDAEDVDDDADVEDEETEETEEDDNSDGVDDEGSWE